MAGIIAFLQSHPEIVRWIGVAGFILYIMGFLLVQLRFICGNGNLYAASQVVAALLVLISLADAFNLPSFLIQVSYAAIGVGGITLRFFNKSGRPRILCHTVVV